MASRFSVWLIDTDNIEVMFQWQVGGSNSFIDIAPNGDGTVWLLDANGVVRHYRLVNSGAFARHTGITIDLSSYFPVQAQGLATDGVDLFAMGAFKTISFDPNTRVVQVKKDGTFIRKFDSLTTDVSQAGSLWCMRDGRIWTITAPDIGFASGRIEILNPDTGTKQQLITNLSKGPWSCAYNGNQFWLQSGSEDAFYILDPSSGRETARYTYSTSTSIPRMNGISFDGHNLIGCQ